MNQLKRQLSVNQLFNGKTKKSSKMTKSLTTIEDLSNEVFFEIFDYVDGCDIIDGFSYLNLRFQNLLNSSTLMLKIKINCVSKSTLYHQCNKIINPNKHRIVSLQIMRSELNYLLFQCVIIDETFNRLESLILREISYRIFDSILFRLYSLSRLHSLTIYYKNIFQNLNNVYSLIFGLPMLKYCKLDITSHTNQLLPVSSILQNNSIQHLVCNNYLNLKKLDAILSYTPRLTRLVCNTLSDSMAYSDMEISISLLNLRYVSIGKCNISFENFKRFIRNKSSQLEVLRMNTIGDLSYLDAERWEQMILEYMPHLRVFDFRYKQRIDDTFELTSLHKSINRFNSCFWITRQWFLELTIDWWNLSQVFISYHIHPLRKRRYHFSKLPTNDNLVSQQNFASETVPLTLGYLSLTTRIELFMESISPILVAANITRLIASNQNTSINILYKFLRLLPNLNSLILESFPWLESSLELNSENMPDNKILKVCLKKLTTLTHVEYLIDLCRLMEHLELININNINLEFLIQFILTKYAKVAGRHIVLCIKHYYVDNNTIQTLQKTVEQHGNWTINFIEGNIFLKC